MSCETENLETGHQGTQGLGLRDLSLVSPLLTDHYELTMAQVYHACAMHDTAVFEFFVRRLPEQRNFLIAAGLEQVLDYLESLRFGSDDLDWLESTGRYTNDFLQMLKGFRFTGNVHAMRAGTAFFANEHLLRVTAPILQAQLRCLPDDVCALDKHQSFTAEISPRLHELTRAVDGAFA